MRSLLGTVDENGGARIRESGLREMGLEAAYDYTGEVMTKNMMARETEEGIDAFIDKRPPPWQRQ